MTLIDTLALVATGGAIGAAYGSAKVAHAGLGGRVLAVSIGAAIGIAGAAVMMRTVYRIVALHEGSTWLESWWALGAFLLGMLSLPDVSLAMCKDSLGDRGPHLGIRQRSR
jgi:hypothetical protein